ncbi:class I adenylate-forming enzyme family protein [soil metagenome]
MTAITRQQAIESLSAPGQPYEIEHIVANGRQVRMFRNAPRSLRELFESTATELPFIVYGDERYSFAQAWQAASRIGHVLVNGCGVKPGDRVAISMRNYPEWLTAFTAITSIGAVAVAMNAHWQHDEMAYCLQDSGAKVLLADQERLDRLAQCVPVPDVQVLAVRATQLPAPLQGRARHLHEATAALGDSVMPVAMPPTDIPPDAVATMLYTSGSSGRPKGVPNTHRNILAALLSWEFDFALAALLAGTPAAAPAEQGGTLLAVPLFHVTGLNSSYLSSSRQQRRIVCMYRWDPELAAQLIDQERLTSIGGPAAITGDLVRVARSGRYDLGTLVAVGGGGAPRAPEQVRQIHSTLRNAAPNIGWGMTETSAIGTLNAGDDYLDRPASSGRCSVVLDIQIVDEAGHVLPAGQRGELWVRGASVFSGYWNLPQVNATAFVGDWFRTGDGAYIDDEGFLFITDRLKDLIIRGGENIGCGQVEAALLMHPDVHEASVYAVPDERLGEEVGATVYGSASLDLDALREFLSAHLARFEMPRYIVHSAEPLPRTPSGKILKRQIRETAVAGLQLSTIPPEATS